MADSWTDVSNWSSTAENPSFDFSGSLGDTVGAGSNTDPASYDLTPNLAVSTGTANAPNPGGVITGALGLVQSTGDSLLKAWGMAQNLSLQKSSMDIARQQASGELAVRKAATDAATAIAQSNSEVEKIRAAAAVTRAQQQADAAKNGTVYVAAKSSLSMGVILAGCVLAYVAFNARRGKK